jgi:recombinational DNA repair protein (RecF pathway)
MLKREVHTRGVVVARRAAGEGSVRVLLYTEELGLVRAAATSAREERSKLRPHLLTGTRGTYSLVKGKAEWRVTGAVGCIHTYFETSERAAQETGERTVALIRQFVHGEGADEGLFAAVWELLVSLPTLGSKDIQIAEYVAVLRILAALGYVAKTGVEVFIEADDTAALVARASDRKRDLVALINRGLGESGL